jgi:hypothetical protein
VRNSHQTTDIDAPHFEAIISLTYKTGLLIVQRCKSNVLSKADLLLRTLPEAGFMVSFFNEKEALLPALQYFGTQGFFHDYNARLAARRDSARCGRS